MGAGFGRAALIHPSLSLFATKNYEPHPFAFRYLISCNLLLVLETNILFKKVGKKE